MKKSKLIELLNTIEGNPDIVFWNGFVQDYQDISSTLVEDRLIKESENHFIDMCRLQKGRDSNNRNLELSETDIIKLKSKYKACSDWKFNDFVSDQDIAEKRYKSKKIVLLQAKNRGVSTWDRLGKLDY